MPQKGHAPLRTWHAHSQPGNHTCSDSNCKLSNIGLDLYYNCCKVPAGCLGHALMDCHDHYQTLLCQALVNLLAGVPPHRPTETLKSLIPAIAQKPKSDRQLEQVEHGLTSSSQRRSIAKEHMKGPAPAMIAKTPLFSWHNCGPFVHNCPECHSAHFLYCKLSSERPRSGRTSTSFPDEYQQDLI